MISPSSVICQTRGPKPLRKRFLHIVRSRASSFNWQYPLLSLRSSSSFLRLLPRLLVTSICPFIFPSITCCRRQFLRKMWPIQLAFRFLISCRIYAVLMSIFLGTLVTVFFCFDQDSIVMVSSKVRLQLPRETERERERERESKRLKYNVLHVQLTRSSEYELYKHKFIWTQETLHTAWFLTATCHPLLE